MAVSGITPILHEPFPIKDVMGDLAAPVFPDYIICFFASGSCISDVIDFLLCCLFRLSVHRSAFYLYNGLNSLPGFFRESGGIRDMDKADLSRFSVPCEGNNLVVKVHYGSTEGEILNR